jgi:hypothetical protein
MLTFICNNIQIDISGLSYTCVCFVTPKIDRIPIKHHWLLLAHLSNDFHSLSFKRMRSVTIGPSYSRKHSPHLMPPLQLHTHTFMCQPAKDVTLGTSFQPILDQMFSLNALIAIFKHLLE